jgi:hypothetical protein
MLISTFNSLLRNKYPTGSAYVPDVYGKQVRSCKVSVTYAEGSKAYTYSGTILSIAERLGLIPEINVVRESEAIVRGLVSGASMVGHVECYDTVRFALPEGMYLVQSDYSIDDYDRRTCVYSTTTDKPKWQS